MYLSRMLTWQWSPTLGLLYIGTFLFSVLKSAIPPGLFLDAFSMYKYNGLSIS